MRLAVGAVSVALLVAACGTSSGPQIHELAQGKWGTGEVLTDLAPMVDLVPLLATSSSVASVAGTRAEPDGAREITVPGPTDYWIDAVVTFEPGDDVLASECGSADIVSEPEVVPELSGMLADGPWRACRPDAFAADGWYMQAYLDAGGNVVLLLMVSL